MAYEPVTIEQLEELAERFRRCARTISTVISDLRARQVNETKAQIVTLNKHVLPRAEDLIEKLEADTTVHPKQAEKLEYERNWQRDRRAKLKKASLNKRSSK